MPRRPRIYFPGAIYHAFARGVDGCAIFIDDHDRIAFLAGMRRMEEEACVRVIAYCLMGNHFHFAIQVGPVTLAAAMQRLLTRYCMWFNRRHGRTGHLFGGRHKSNLCADERYLVGLIRYIHMNPVRAGLVAAPGDWPWSSYEPGESVGTEVLDFDPWPKETRDVAMLRVEAEPVDLEAIGSAASIITGIGLDAMRSGCRERRVVAARRVFVRDAVRKGFSLIALASWLNTTRSSVSRYALPNNAITGGLTPGYDAQLRQSVCPPK